MDQVSDAIKTFGHDELVTIELQNCTEIFTVSKAHLCDASDYFMKALEGGFMESKTRKLCLPGCDRRTFEIFMFYIAKKQLPDLVESAGDVCHDCLSRARVWTFGEAYLMPQLQDLAMCQIIKTVGNLRPNSLTELLILAYDQTAIGSALRRVVMDEYVYDINCRLDTLEEGMDSLEAIPGFLSHLVRRTQDYYKGEYRAPSSKQSLSMYMVVEKPRAVEKWRNV